MGTYTDVFGGSNVYPSDVSYLALSLTEDTTMSWPLESNAGANVVARVIDVTPSGAYSIIMPPADETGSGQIVLFNNLGPYDIIVTDADGNELLTAAQGEQWELYLTDNSTTAGSWRAFRFGAATAQAQASALAGAGLLASSSMLAQNYPVTELSIDYDIGASDRAGFFVWVGGLGTITLPPASVGNGFFVMVRNAGSGNVVIDPNGSELINDASDLTLRPGDSVVVVSNDSAWNTVGFGQEAVFAFDYTSIDLTGQSSPYTLSGAELNRISYKFTGTLTDNMEVVVPATTQQYWITNDTSGSFTLGFRTPSQVSPLMVTQDAAVIYYCDGADVVNADTAGIAFPISISSGGTGATTASGARVNLGGTSTGIAVFTSASEAAARTAIGAVGSASPTFTGTITADKIYASGQSGQACINTKTGVTAGAATSFFSQPVSLNNLRSSMKVSVHLTNTGSATGYADSYEEWAVSYGSNGGSYISPVNCTLISRSQASINASVIAISGTVSASISADVLTIYITANSGGGTGFTQAEISATAQALGPFQSTAITAT